MMATTDPVLQALVDAAVNGTGGTDGWLLARRGEVLEAVAASGPSAVTALGLTLPADAGTSGFVASSGQPIALVPRPGGTTLTSAVAALVGKKPLSVLAIPCESDEGVAGALEVIDKVGGGSFSFDDVELATILAGIAGVAMQEAVAPQARVPGPQQIAAELARLAETAPNRYAAVASAVSALIGSV